MQNVVLSSAVFALAALLSVSPVHAASISIFSTGVDSSGALLSSGATDPHYSIVSGPNGAQPASAQYLAPGYWVSNTARSQWIAPTSGDGSVGTFVYQTTFSLSGTDSASALLSGLVTADNELTILLNGVNVYSNNNSTEWSSLTPFTIRSGFVSGLNTLDFDVHNDGSYSGLQVQISGVTSPSTVSPEPGTFGSVLLLGGLVALGSLAARKLRA